MMKKHLISLMTFLLLGFLSVLTVYAQAPEKFTYQAEARDSHGCVIKNAHLEVKITIMAGSLNGIIVWEGIHEINTDKYGLFTLIIGEGKGGAYSFSAIDWANNSHFLNVKVTDRKGNWVDMGTSQFLSVPYAIYGQDEDSDPENEIQELILDGNILSISGGNSITLPESANEGSFYFADHDGDGFGNTYEPLWVPSSTTAPQGYSANQGDCNDDDGNINPDAEEICRDDIDSDCNGIDCAPFDIDDDEDGYTENQGDCDDNDPTRNPGVQEICGDGIDQDCTSDDLDCNDLEGRLANGESVSDLLDEGFTVMELFNAGAGVGSFEQYGISQQELTDLGLIGTLSDIDGNNYKWVRIGDQYWMAENLTTTAYNDGTPINHLISNSDWYNNTTGAYCWYDNSVNIEDPPYGKLYNWYTIDNGNLCPTGWHVPTNDEFTELTDNLGGISIAGKKLKEIGTQHWNDLNTGTNESGFGAVAGGYRYNTGTFYGWDTNGQYWTSSEYESYDTYSYYMYVNYFSNSFWNSYSNKGYGRSVRCIKD